MLIINPKIRKIISNECESIKERYDGYQTDLSQLIEAIITEESEHRLHSTNIQQRINNKCNAVGDRLYKTRPQITKEGI